MDGLSLFFADPEDNIKAFGGTYDTYSQLEASMMKYLAVQQALCGATLLAGQGQDGQKGAECVALAGAAVGVVLMACV